MIISNLLVYSAICSVGLLLIYCAIRQSRVGMTRYGRSAILGSVLTVALAATVPLIVGWNTRPIHVVAISNTAAAVADTVPAYVAPTPPATVSWAALLGFIYIIGVILASGHMLLTIGRIVLLIIQSEREGDICLSRQEGIVPFSWGGRIVMSRSDYETNGPILAAHEMAHKAAGHWIDLLAINILGCLTWYCPAARLIRRELQATHEFEADRAVLASGIDPMEYQMLLISKASGKRFANSISDSLTNKPLKQRILMMQNPASGRRINARNLALIPATITLIALASSPLLASIARSTMPARTTIVEIPELTAISAAEETLPAENAVYETVDSEPQFPGGAEALYRFLATSIRYPEECAKRDIQGTVYVKYVVKADGSIGDVNVLKAVDYELDAEAVRVVRRLPRYTPGKIGNTPVDVSMTLPISFKLQ